MDIVVFMYVFLAVVLVELDDWRFTPDDDRRPRSHFSGIAMVAVADLVRGSDGFITVVWLLDGGVLIMFIFKFRVVMALIGGNVIAPAS